MYILDTDHLTHLAWANSSQGQRLLHKLAEVAADQLATTVISYEEQTRGWLALLAQARTLSQQVEAYRRLERHVDYFRRIPMLGFDEAAATIFSALQKEKLRLGTMDLRIAAIALAHRATLLTCNRADFEKVSGLSVEDWTR